MIPSPIGRVKLPWPETKIPIVYCTYDFRHVQDDNGRLKTDTETSNETTSSHGSQSRAIGRGSDLDNNTSKVDHATSNNRPLATNVLGDVASNESSEEGTGREDGHDERLVLVGESIGGGALDGVDEGGGALDTVDVARVVTEEETSHRGEGAHHVGLPGDRSLDALDVGGGVQTSRRDGGRVVIHLVGDGTLLERHGDGCWRGAGWQGGFCRLFCLCGLSRRGWSLAKEE